MLEKWRASCRRRRREAIDLRTRLLGVDSMIAGDEYLFLRDAYLQQRDYLIKDGEIEDDPFLDDDFAD